MAVATLAILMVNVQAKSTASLAATNSANASRIATPSIPRDNDGSDAQQARLLPVAPAAPETTESANSGAGSILGVPLKIASDSASSPLVEAAPVVKPTVPGPPLGPDTTAIRRVENQVEELMVEGKYLEAAQTAQRGLPRERYRVLRARIASACFAEDSLVARNPNCVRIP